MKKIKKIDSVYNFQMDGIKSARCRAKAQQCDRGIQAIDIILGLCLLVSLVAFIWG